MNKRKRLLIISLVICIIFNSFTLQSFAKDNASSSNSGRWMYSSGGWWYENSDGSYPYSEWKEIDGKWYYFDYYGYSVSEWKQIGRYWYYFGDDCSLKTGWQKIEGKWYLFDENGRMQTGWIEDNGDWYYFKDAGNMLTGWVYDDGFYYYCDRTTGVMRRDYTVNGISLNAAGKAVISGNDYYKIDTMIMADDIVDEYIDQTASQSSQIYACYVYVRDFPYNQYRTLKSVVDTDYWESEFARDIFENGKGCCVSEASALAFLFTELNIGTCYVDHDGGHAWTEMNGRYWDPLFAEAKGEEYLNMDPNDYYTNHPVGWREI